MSRIAKIGIVFVIALIFCGPSGRAQTGLLKWRQIEPHAEVTSITVSATGEFGGFVQAPGIGASITGARTMFDGSGIHFDQATALGDWSTSLFSVLTPGWIEGLFTAGGNARVDDDLLVGGRIYCGTDVPNAGPTGTVYVYFGPASPGTPKYLLHDRATGRFQFSDDLNVYGYIENSTTIATYGPYIELRQLTDIPVGLKFHDGGTAGGYERFYYNPTTNQFFTTQHLYVTGAVQAQSNLVADDNVYVNYDLDAAPQQPAVFFGKPGNAAAEWLKYDIATDTFELSGNLDISGIPSFSTGTFNPTNLDLAGWLNVDGTAAFQASVRTNTIGLNQQRVADSVGGTLDFLADGSGAHANGGIAFKDEGSYLGYLEKEQGLHLNSLSPLTVDATSSFIGKITRTPTFDWDLKIEDNLWVGADADLVSNIYMGNVAGQPKITRNGNWLNLDTTLVTTPGNLQITGTGNLTLDSGFILLNSAPLYLNWSINSYLDENASKNVELYVEGDEIIEAASNFVYFRKNAVIPALTANAAMTGGSIAVYDSDGTAFDGIRMLDDGGEIVQITGEKGVEITGGLTVSATAEIPDVSVTGNLDAAGNVQVGGFVSAANGVYAPGFLKEAGSGQINCVNSDGTTADGINFYDDSTFLGAWSLERGLSTTGGARGSVTIPSASMALTGSSFLTCATNAFDITVSAQEIGGYALWAATGTTAIAYPRVKSASADVPIPYPHRLNNATCVITKIWLYVGDTYVASLFEDLQVGYRDVSNAGAFTQIAYYSTDIGSAGGTGNHAVQVLASPITVSTSGTRAYCLRLDIPVAVNPIVDNDVSYFSGIGLYGIRITGYTTEE